MNSLTQTVERTVFSQLTAVFACVKCTCFFTVSRAACPEICCKAQMLSPFSGDAAVKVCLGKCG